MTGRTVVDPAAAHSGQRFKHCAFIYENEEEFLAVTVPFLRAGLEADDVVTVVTPEARNKALQEALGRDASLVQFGDGPSFYDHPARVLTAYEALAKTYAPRRIRLVAQGIWDFTPIETMEWYRYDSIVNEGLAQSDITAICCYDRSVAPPEVIEHARRSHPEVFDGQKLLENQDYMDPRSFSAMLDQQPLAQSPQSAASMQIESTDLHIVRNFVAEQARRYGIESDALHNLLVAVTEVVTNAIRHGTAPTTLYVWPDGEHFICEIRDSGHWRPDELTGWIAPEHASDTGFGLWGARALCDIMQIRGDDEGTVVRLRSKL